MARAKKWIYLNNEIMVKKDGEFQLEKDKEAVYSYFIDYVNKNTVFFHNLKEKMDYLIENDYYINFYDMYTFEEIKEVFKSVYNKKFRFASFMSASKFYQSYALRDDTGEKFLERYEESFIAESNTYPIPLRLSPISSRKHDTSSPDLFFPELRNVGVAG